MLIFSKGNLNWDDKAFKFGLGIFETILVKNGWVYFLEDHINRLVTSSKELKIGSLFLEDAIKTLIEMNFLENESYVIRLTLIDSGYWIEKRENIYSYDYYNKGMSLTVYPFYRGINPLFNYKMTSYAENIYAKTYSNERGYDDCIFLNDKGNILECSMANIYFRKNNSFVVPTHNNNILKGIAQKNIISILSYEFGYEVIYDYVNKDDLHLYDEIYISNSIMHLMPINKVDYKEFNINSKLCLNVNKFMDNYNGTNMNNNIVVDFINNVFLKDNDNLYIFLTGSSRKSGYSKKRDIDIFVIDTITTSQKRYFVRYHGYDWDINVLSLNLAKKLLSEKVDFIVKAINESTFLWKKNNDENLRF